MRELLLQKPWYAGTDYDTDTGTDADADADANVDADYDAGEKSKVEEVSISPYGVAVSTFRITHPKDTLSGEFWGRL